jgi:hypothetical protein
MITCTAPPAETTSLRIRCRPAGSSLTEVALLFGILAACHPALSGDEEDHGYTRREKRQSKIDRQESPAYEQLTAHEAGDHADGRAADQQRDDL